MTLTVPANRTNRDAVEQIAREAGIPVESLPGELNQPVCTRAQAIFGFAGDQFDEIACNHDNIQWWVSDTGLNMAIVSPASPSRVPTLDDLLRGEETEAPRESRKARKPMRRRTPRYEEIDAALKLIAESRPRRQEEVFQMLDQHHVVFPLARPFVAARGWTAGFGKDPPAARAWLSKRWTELELPPLPRGPKGGSRRK